MARVHKKMSVLDILKRFIFITSGAILSGGRVGIVPRP